MQSFLTRVNITHNYKENGNDKENGSNKDKEDKDNNGKAIGKDKEKNNNGKHLGWYKNKKNPHYAGGENGEEEYDLTNPEIFQVTNYINDLSEPISQVLMTTDVDGNYRGVYTYDNESEERISEEDLGHIEGVPNDPLYYLKDALGTITAITNMNASIIDSNRFAPYGEALDPVAKNARLTNSPFGYTGESHDIEGGLVYLRARYYEPDTMRFLQQDTELGDIKNPLTRNLYAYAGGNPVRYVDPSGHFLSAREIENELGSFVKAGVKTGAFIIEVGVSGYAILKRVTPVGIATWVLFTPTQTASAEYEKAEIKKWADEHKNDIGPNPPKPPKPPKLPKPPKPTLVERIAQISAASSAIKDNIKDWGTEAYMDMTILLKNTGLQAHHIIEQRFASVLEIKDSNLMYSIAVTPQQHQLFTNAWRTAIGYVNSNGQWITTSVTKLDVYNTALKIYKDFPEIIKIIKHAMEINT